MFSHQHRKARVLFGVSDVLLTALAFEAAYQTRVLLHFEHAFYLDVPNKTLVLGFSLMAWIVIGLWVGVYDKLDSGDPRSPYFLLRRFFLAARMILLESSKSMPSTLQIITSR